MFYFYSTKQSATNARYHKGLLFEQLLRTFLSRSAYEIELRRTNINSLEYDLVGKHSLDQRAVIGEAKAHEDTITGQTLQAFVGKFASQHFKLKGNVTGLFLSTSALSPDGEDSFREVKETTPFTIERHTGKDLEDRIRRVLALPDDAAVRVLVRDHVPTLSATHLLHTDLGTYIVAVGAGPSGAFPDRFAVVNGSGTIVADRQFAAALRNHIPAFQELDAVSPDSGPGRGDTRSEIPNGLITATDWFDYRHPAGPKVFVGRSDALGRADEALDDAKQGIVLEVKSRSGVGKSSLLSALYERWRNAGHGVELHDARDARSAVDGLALVQRFTRSPTPLQDLEAIPAALQRLSDALGTRSAAFMVDQFEATFQAPEVFRAYEYVAMSIVRGAPRIAMVFARKDDLLTTYDDLQVDIDRLRGMARAIVLDDFPRGEATDLLHRIAAQFPRKLNPQMLAQVLEFAQGFPWLAKANHGPRPAHAAAAHVTAGLVVEWVAP
jgi:hypothetical protein